MNNLLKEKLNYLKLSSKNIYYRAKIKNDNSQLLDTIAAAMYGGIDIIELSGRNITAAEFYTVASKVKLLAAQFNTTFIIDERVDIAYLLESDGIFLKDSDLSIKKAHKLLEQTSFIGTDNTQNSDADYYLSDTVIKSNIPTFISCNENIETCKTLIQTGIRHIFVSDLITNSKSPHNTSIEIKTLLEKFK